MSHSDCVIRDKQTKLSNGFAGTFTREKVSNQEAFITHAQKLNAIIWSADHLTAIRFFMV